MIIWLLIIGVFAFSAVFGLYRRGWFFKYPKPREFHDQIWKRDKRWNTKKIHQDPKKITHRVIGTVICFAFNLALLILIYVANQSGKGDMDELLWFAWFFMVLFTLTLIYAFYALRRWFKYSKSIFMLETYPGEVGGLLKGRLITPAGLEGPLPFQARLLCIYTYLPTRGKRVNRKSYALWSEKKLLPPAHQRSSSKGTVFEVDVEFQIPAGCRETDERDFRKKVSWILIVTANIPGIDFHAEFPVPVFNLGNAAQRTK